MNQETVHEMRTKQVESYRNSGMTARVWCEENQVSIHTLKYWIQKLNRQEKVHHNPKWVSLVQEQTLSYSITIHIGSAALEVNSGFDPQLLAQVIKVLQATC